MAYAARYGRQQVWNGGMMEAPVPEVRAFVQALSELVKEEGPQDPLTREE